MAQQIMLRDTCTNVSVLWRYETETFLHARHVALPLPIALPL